MRRLVEKIGFCIAENRPSNDWVTDQTRGWGKSSNQGGSRAPLAVPPAATREEGVAS